MSDRANVLFFTPEPRAPIFMYRFVTFGGCAVVSAEGEVKGAATQQRRLALLAVLARSGDRGVSRSRLLQLFWPDEADEERRRKALAQALYALRRDLGDDGVIVGTQELRLDAELLPHDVGLFAEHLRQQRPESAVALYEGPFLSGFHLAGAPAFERWAEEERRVLERDYLRAVESLAALADREERSADAVMWWRRIAAVDPLDSRATLGLMRALVSNGEVTAAIRQAAIHETLIQQDLELAPDREVVAYAEELRARPPVPKAPREERAVTVVGTVGAAVSAPTAQAGAASDTAPAVTPDAAPVVTPDVTPVVTPPVVQPAAPPVAQLAAQPAAQAAAEQTGPPGDFTVERRAVMSKPSWTLRQWTFTAMAVVIVAAGGAIGMRVFDATPAEFDAGVTLAVGRIMDYRERPAVPAGALTDMLATSIARIDGLRVLSNARMLEVGARVDRDEARDGLRLAAHAAGVTDLLEGAIQPLEGQRILLDLRRVSVKTGTIVSAYRFEGTDVFALVSAATNELATAFGRQPAGDDSLQSATRSLVAYRFYEEGLRAFSRSDLTTAEGLLAAAVAEDSLFAMAAFKLYQTRSLLGRYQPNDVLASAVRLAQRGSNRERLTITAYWAFTTARPELQALADTLAIRYPDEPDGAYYQAIARLQDGDSPAAIPLLRRLLMLDSLSSDLGVFCRACDATESLLFAYQSLDSTAAAESLVRHWVRVQPQSPRAWTALAGYLLHMDRADEAIDAHQRASAMGDNRNVDVFFPAAARMHAGDLEAADRLLTAAEATGAPLNGVLGLRITLRHLEGRLDEAERLSAEWLRAVPGEERGSSVGRQVDWRRSVMWLQRGQPLRAFALLDSLARFDARDADPGQVARLQVQRWAVAASVAAEARDVMRSAAWADSAASWGARAPTRRDPRTAAWARGVAVAAAGDTSEAIVTLQQALYWPAFGLPRLNADLARLMLARGRYLEAVQVARGGLRAPFDLRSSVADFTTTRLLLARAWDGAGQRDSARAHWAVVSRSWRNADPPLRNWADSATRRLAESPSVGSRIR